MRLICDSWSDQETGARLLISVDFLSNSCQ